MPREGFEELTRFENGVRAVKDALKKHDYEGAWRAVDAYRLSALERADLNLPPRPKSVPAPKQRVLTRRERLDRFGVGSN